MPEYLSPGVYVEEIEIGSKPIEGVSTSTAGFLGETERGPTKPKLVTSWLQYLRLYGGPFETEAYLPYAVEGFFRNGGKRCYIARIVGKSAKTASYTLVDGEGNVALTVEAVGEGNWGNRVALKFSEGTENGFRLSVFYWKKEIPEVLFDPETDRKSQPRPDMTEVFDNLSVEENSPTFYGKKVNGISALVRIVESGKMFTPPADIVVLSDGDDGGTIGLGDYVRDDITEPGKRRGLGAFEEIDEISIVYAPRALETDGLAEALVEHCEIRMKDRFAIIDAKEESADVSALKPRDAHETSFAAFYYPWIEIVDTESGMRKMVPPGGHIAGVYARSDVERGVHKAPANESLRGVVGLEFPIGKGEQDILNPRGVNCIRAFPGRGIRVWGARTLSSDPLWKYVNVRRLFLYLEESIDEGTQWVVFEPNSEILWARVRQTITNFLTRVWKEGALMGTTPEEAFFVKCDRTTMTQDDIDNGRLICVIGVAPVKPAEFVVFRIAQWTGNASASE